MSYLDQSLDAALLSNTTAANAVAAGSNGSGVGALGSHEAMLVWSLLSLIVRLLPRKHRA